VTNLPECLQKMFSHFWLKCWIVQQKPSKLIGLKRKVHTPGKEGTGQEVALAVMLESALPGAAGRAAVWTAVIMTVAVEVTGEVAVLIAQAANVPGIGSGTQTRTRTRMREKLAEIVEGL